MIFLTKIGNRFHCHLNCRLNLIFGLNSHIGLWEIIFFLGLTIFPAKLVNVMKASINIWTRRVWIDKILHNSGLKILCRRSAFLQAWELNIPVKWRRTAPLSKQGHRRRLWRVRRRGWCGLRSPGPTRTRPTSPPTRNKGWCPAMSLAQNSFFQLKRIPTFLRN